MKTKTLEHLQHFVGKVCTVFTPPINRSFDELRSREHFTIRIYEISMDGIWGTHPYNEELVSFFPIEHVMLVQQEVELDPENPEHKTMIEEYEKKTGKKISGDLGAPPKEKPKPAPFQILSQAEVIQDESASDDRTTFVDIDSLAKLAEQTKRTYDLMDLTSK